MVSTPSTSHVTRAEWDQVYEPAEDTFALLDALEADAALLRSHPCPLVVELGCGSGVVSTFVATLLGPHHGVQLATDLNPVATTVAARTAHHNSRKPIDTILTSLLLGLAPRLRGKIDVLLFNPPYVPTTEAEEAFAQRAASTDRALYASWAGGSTGTALVDALLLGSSISGGIPLWDLLAPGGSAYVVAIKQNDPRGMVKRLEQLGFEAEVRSFACLLACLSFVN